MKRYLVRNEYFLSLILYTKIENSDILEGP